jgi:hypothetical protein
MGKEFVRSGACNFAIQNDRRTNLYFLQLVNILEKNNTFLGRIPKPGYHMGSKLHYNVPSLRAGGPGLAITHFIKQERWHPQKSRGCPEA